MGRIKVEFSFESNAVNSDDGGAYIIPNNLCDLMSRGIQYWYYWKKDLKDHPLDDATITHVNSTIENETKMLNEIRKSITVICESKKDQIHRHIPVGIVDEKREIR